MNRKISDYAVIGDCEAAALVSREGSIEFLCWPRFHSEACMAQLVGDKKNGHWSVRPHDFKTVKRDYCEGTPILQTRFESRDGAATLIDFMPIRQDNSDNSTIVRIVKGEFGSLAMHMSLALRFDYGRLGPWISAGSGSSVDFVFGPHSAKLTSDTQTRCDNSGCHSDFTIGAGEQKSFTLQYWPSHREPPPAVDVNRELGASKATWHAWCRKCEYRGPSRHAVMRSLITLKLMASRQTGGIVAAPTMGLPEKLGGRRNWDYRFCWLRDATFTLLALLHSGFHEEASAWRDWLLRAVAGMPRQVQPIYGVAGEHRLPEWEIDWLGGFRKSRPIRAGNAAYQQLQIDAYGEVLDALHQSREQGVPPEDWSWRLQKELIEQVERVWCEPDSGIWESRHGREHFTHSRVMAWVALDRAIRAAEKYSLDWPLERWRQLRRQIHNEVCQKGYDAELGFVRSYKSREPDAANLMIPIVGFLPADDPRVLKTVESIEQKLMNNGFVMRYDSERSEDGLPVGEGAFLACSFWYLDNLVMQGRMNHARQVFDRLLDIRNDVGLLSEEYDPETGEMLGNFPQGLSHVCLINSAYNLEQGFGPAHARSSPAVAKQAEPAQAS